MEPVNGNYQSRLPSNSGVGDDPYDDNQTFEELADAAYEAGTVLNSNPNAASASAYMTAMTALNTYLTVTAPNPPSGSLGAKLLADLNQDVGPGQTLASICANQTNIGYIATNSQNQYITGFLSDVTNANNSYVDTSKSGISTIQADISHLTDLLQTYRDDMKIVPPDPSCINSDLNNIAGFLSKLNSDATAFGGFHDGFLSILITQLNSPTSTTSGAPTLLATCAALIKTPSDPTALANMQAALNAMGENNSGGGSLAALMAKSYSEEPWPA